MARICFLITATRDAWSDRRQLLRQGPALAEDGHEITFVAANPGETDTGPIKFYVLEEKTRRNVRITGGLNVFHIIKKLEPDAVQLCSIEQLPLGLALKVLTKIKVIYDCREDMPSAFSNRDRWLPVGRFLMARLAKYTEYAAGCVLDAIITADPWVEKIFSQTPAAKKMVFYNTPQLSLFSPDYLPVSRRKYDAVMMGSMTMRSGVKPFIEAVGILKERGMEINVLLLGEPDKFVRASVDELIERYSLEKTVTITGKIPHRQVPEMLKQAKIGVVPLMDMPKFRKNIACKAFEYMACGMPVLSSDLPPERLFIRDGENGLLFEPDNVKEFADKMQYLLNHLGEAERMGRQGRKDVEEKWNCEQVQEKLKEFYRRILTAK